MRAIVTSEQTNFFSKNGYIKFENLLSTDEIKKVFSAIQETQNKAPKYPETHLARSIPFLIPLIRKKQLGEIAFLLSNLRPLRLEYDEFFCENPKSKSLDNQSLGLLLSLEDGSGLYFKNDFPAGQLYNENKGCYLLLIFTKKPISLERKFTVYD